MRTKVLEARRLPEEEAAAEVAAVERPERLPMAPHRTVIKRHKRHEARERPLMCKLILKDCNIE